MEPDKIIKAAREAVAPSTSTRRMISKALHDYSIHIVIVVVTSIVVFIPPLCAGCLQGDVSLFFPTNAAGWTLWVLTNSASAIGNVSLLVLFKMQAKRNVRDNENFKQANEIVRKIAREKEVFIPRSPAKMNATEYLVKSICIIAATLASFLVISSIIINFDPVTLISTVLSATIALCVSWITMLRNEEYWIDEYLLWAKMMEEKLSQPKGDKKK